MTPARILDYIRHCREPVSSRAISEAFGMTVQCINEHLRALRDEGRVIVGKHRNYPVYSCKAQLGDESVLPRYVPAFKPLKAMPSPLGTREGSNDHLQYKSKHF